MQITPETCPDISSGTAPNGGNGNGEGKPNRPTLPDFFFTQRGESKEKGFDKTNKKEAKRKESYEQILANKELTGKSKGVFIDALTREFMAIQDVDAEGVESLNQWQRRIYETGKTSFNESNNNAVDLSKASNKDMYDAYRSVFEDLLGSKNADQSQEWLVTGMEIAKRQIMATEAATQAQTRVIREADEINFVDDIEVMSAALSNESGRSIDELREELVDLRKKQTGKPGFFNLWGKLKAAVHRGRVGHETSFREKGIIKNLWRQYEQEVRKNPYSTVDIEFPGGHTVDYNRTINGQPLDAVQKKMLENLRFVGTRDTGGELGPKGQEETARLLKDMTGALQDAYFAKFDTQLRTQDQLNLVEADPANPSNYLTTNSLLDEVRPGIEGVPAMPVNVDNIAGMSMDQRLNWVTQHIGDRVAERVLKQDVSDVQKNVKARIDTLQKPKELTSAEQTQKDELERLKGVAEQVESLSQEIQAEESQKNTLETEIADALTARGDKQTAVTEKAAKEREKAKLVSQKERKQSQLDSITRQIETLRKGLGEGEKTADQITAINDQISLLEGKVTPIENDISGAGGLDEQINDTQGEIRTHEETINQKQTIIEAQQEELGKYDQLVNAIQNKRNKRDAIADQYPRVDLNVSRIEKALQRLEKGDDLEQHELQALEAFQNEVLTDTKFSDIQSRAQFEKYSDPVVRKEMQRAMDIRPNVQPAYLMMLRTLGGVEAIQNTPEGQKLFSSLTKVVPPELFFDVYKQNIARVARLQNAYWNVHGQLPTDDELWIYNEALNDPRIRNQMLQEIDKDFVNDLLSRLITDANAGKLGTFAKVDQAKLQEISEAQLKLPADHGEREKAQLEQRIRVHRREYQVAREEYGHMAAENVIAEIISQGLSVDQTPEAVNAVRTALENAGIDRDVTLNDLTNPPLDSILPEPFVDLGIHDLNMQVELINTLRKTPVDQEVLQSQMRIEEAVVDAGLNRYQAPYVASALRRAMLKAGISGGTITEDDLLDVGAGTLTEMGTFVEGELSQLNINISPDRQAELINNLSSEPIYQVFVTNVEAKLAGTAAAGTALSPHDHALVAYRTVLSEKIKRDQPFTAADITPDIKNKVQQEYQQTGIDISAAGLNWSDNDIAAVIEAARPREDVLRLDIDPSKNQAFVDAITLNRSFTAEDAEDVMMTVQFLLRNTVVPPNLTEAMLPQQMPDGSGRTWGDFIRENLRNTGMNGDEIARKADSTVARVINTVQNIGANEVSPQTAKHTNITDKVIEDFLEFDASYHESAVIAVLLAEADTDTAKVLRDALEAEKNAQGRGQVIDIPHILAHIPNPPRAHIEHRIGHIESDGARGFIEQYNALPGVTPAATMADIPIAAVRKLAGSVLAHRLGSSTVPHAGYIDQKQEHLEDFMNARFTRIDLDRRVQKLDAKYWGLNDEQLTIAIEKELGGEARRDEAILYAREVMEKRRKRGDKSEDVSS